MTTECEVCAGLEAAGAELSSKRRGTRLFRRILIETRIFRLCDEHAAEVHLQQLDTIADVLTHFREPGGKRSVLERRAPLDRRVFPPRPEGRRRGDDRRDVEATGTE